MNQGIQVAYFCTLLILWVILIAVSSAFLIRWHPTRYVLCGSIAILSAIVAFFASFIDTGPTADLTWKESILFGLGMFIVSLLWSYLAPWIKGMTWDEVIADALERGKRTDKR